MFTIGNFILPPNPKNTLELLIQSIPKEDEVGEQVAHEITAKVEKISSLLRQNPDLMNDSKVISRVLTFTARREDPAVKTLRKTLIYGFSCRIDTLKISEEELLELGDGLWESIKSHGVKKLVIGESIVYETRVLKQFKEMEKKPPVDTLIEKYILKFEGGKQHIESTKAKLRLCGSVLEEMFDLSDFKNNEIDLSASPLSRDDFEEILKEVETGKSKEDGDAYSDVCDFLGYSKYWDPAEEVIGSDQWKSVGFEVVRVPPLPDDLDEILNSECPYFAGRKVHQTHKLILMPGGLSINEQGSLMRHLREGGNETVFSYIWEGITPEMLNQKITEPYWALITTRLILKSQNKDFSEQQELIKTGYEVSSALEAMTFITMDRVYPSEKEECLSPKRPYMFVRCKDRVNNLQLVLAAYCKYKFSIDLNYFIDNRIGVFAVRKFY